MHKIVTGWVVNITYKDNTNPKQLFYINNFLLSLFGLIWSTLVIFGLFSLIFSILSMLVLFSLLNPTRFIRSYSVHFGLIRSNLVLFS